jgi:hypothetical protein
MNKVYKPSGSIKDVELSHKLKNRQKRPTVDKKPKKHVKKCLKCLGIKENSCRLISRFHVY